MAAVADSPIRIGVDIERADAVAPDERRLFVGAREREPLEQLDATLAWVLKEAAWKALELGKEVPFTALQLGFDPGSRVLRALWIDTQCVAARAHVLRPRGLVAAVVTVGEEAR
jgi:4'-phosphopantetheinyl transferase EntD